MVAYWKKIAFSAALVAALLMAFAAAYASSGESSSDPDLRFLDSVLSSEDEFLGWPEDYSEEPDPPTVPGTPVKITEAKHPKDAKLMDMVCRYGKNKHSTTPLCGDWDLFYSLKGISAKEGIPFVLQIGINNKESKLGTAYNKAVCADRNNWGGTKGAMSAELKKTTGKFPDSQGCYLYRFPSVTEFWASQARSLRYGYFSKGCTSAQCIARYYLTGDRVKWVSDVNRFYLSWFETPAAKLP